MQNKGRLKFYKDVFEFWEKEYGVRFTEEEKAQIRMRVMREGGGRMKKVIALLKKFWKIILIGVGVIVSIIFAKQIAEYKKRKNREELKRKLEELREKKELKQQELERELERLKKEAEEREKTDKFNSINDALDYFNSMFRRIQGDPKK